MTYLTEERLLIQKSAREFAMKEVLPAANELDRVKGDIPMSIRDQMGQLGYFGMRIPERYGGLELGVFEYILVTEELARAWMSVASIIARGNGLGGGFSDEQEAAIRRLIDHQPGGFELHQGDFTIHRLVVGNQ